MLTEALNDVAALRAEGLKPSDADVVRLNALYLRISNAAEIAPTEAPRVAFAGDTVFHQPTLAALYFMQRARQFCRGDEELFWLAAFSYAHAREPGFFEGLYAPDEIRRAVNKWKRSLAATRREVERAVVVVAVGDDGEEAEPTELAKARNLTEFDRERRNYAALEETLGVAAKELGFTLQELLTETPGRLGRLIYLACVRDGREMNSAQAKAHADYLATLAAIRKRLEMEKNDGAHH